MTGQDGPILGDAGHKAVHHLVHQAVAAERDDAAHVGAQLAGQRLPVAGPGRGKHLENAPGPRARAEAAPPREAATAPRPLFDTGFAMRTILPSSMEGTTTSLLTKQPTQRRPSDQPSADLRISRCTLNKATRSFPSA